MVSKISLTVDKLVVVSILSTLVVVMVPRSCAIVVGKIDSLVVNVGVLSSTVEVSATVRVVDSVLEYEIVVLSSL